MPRSMWSGMLSFGLVSMPVRLYNALSPKDVRFKRLHSSDLGRVHSKYVCAHDGEEVPFTEIVRGYEIAPERWVVLSDEELNAIRPPCDHSIDIEEFVDGDEIDPVYLEHPYYLVPASGGAKPYRLLHRAMLETGSVAIGRIVLRTRERLVAIRPRGNALLLSTMRYGDEVRKPAALRRFSQERVDISEQEIDITRRVVASLVRPFDIHAYHDTYREAVLDLIDHKVTSGEPDVESPETVEPLPVVDLPQPLEEAVLPQSDLMDVLTASLEQARAREAEEEAGTRGARKRPRRSRRPVSSESEREHGVV
jgi:DNA end-binding protein Ku